MPNPYFSFKKFTVYHNLCAMKVGTDGVLLGAWTDISESKRILDIGTGSGLIALMLAQRCEASITGIDIDKDATTQAQINFEASPWSNRIEAIHTDLCNFNPSCSYDTIVSNPPFFADSLKGPDFQRNAARHNDTLTLTDLMKKVSLILRPEGKFSIVYPFEQNSQIKQTAQMYGLYPSRHTSVVTRPGLPPKRSLFEFRKQPSAYTPQELVIELDRHVYSEEYIALTKDFYLKM